MSESRHDELRRNGWSWRTTGGGTPISRIITGEFVPTSSVVLQSKTIAHDLGATPKFAVLIVYDLASGSSVTNSGTVLMVAKVGNAEAIRSLMLSGSAVTCPANAGTVAVNDTSVTFSWNSSVTTNGFKYPAKYKYYIGV